MSIRSLAYPNLQSARCFFNSFSTTINLSHRRTKTGFILKPRSSHFCVAGCIYFYMLMFLFWHWKTQNIERMLSEIEIRWGAFGYHCLVSWVWQALTLTVTAAMMPTCQLCTQRTLAEGVPHAATQPPGNLESPSLCCSIVAISTDDNTKVEIYGWVILPK